MKKALITSGIILAIAAIAIFAIAKTSGQQYDQSKANQKVTISWSEVNIRKSHSTNSGIVDTLHKGDTVVLTGYSYEYIGGDGENTESWVEVITHEEGVYGWIVTKSIEW